MTTIDLTKKTAKVPGVHRQRKRQWHGGGLFLLLLVIDWEISRQTEVKSRLAPFRGGQLQIMKYTLQ